MNSISQNKMKNFKSLVAGGLLAAAMLTQFITAHAVLAQGPNRVVCGDNQVAVAIPINGQNCIDKGTTLETNPIFLLLTTILKFLSVGVGVAAVGGIVYGGYLYLTARGNSSKTTQGVITIINSLVGVLLYALMFAIINFLVPGGVLQ